MSIESLKQQARKHEQNEDWGKALDHYRQALDALARDEQVDIGLYNRVGDLYVRVGDLDEAVEYYDKAVGLYREAYLPNNAIAVCKKIIRNAPDRHRAYLLIGQIRAEQGFIPDARTNFLTYAERMSQDGDLDESFRALIEFCDLVPTEVDLRLTVAEQMASSGRTEDATQQLLSARRHYADSGMAAEAQRIEARILELDPAADLSAGPAMPSVASPSNDQALSDFAEFTLDGGGGPEDDGTPVVADVTEDTEDTSISFDGPDLGAFEISAPAGDDAADEGGFDLPMLSIDDDDGSDMATELPMMELAGDEDGGFDLPLIGTVEADEPGEAAPLPTLDFDMADADGGFDLPTLEPSTESMTAERDDDDPGFSLTPPEPEVSDAVEAAPDEAALEVDLSIAEPSDAPAAFEEPVAEAAETETTVPEVPVAGPSDGGFVDFGAMILGDPKDKDTRMRVSYEEPSGDEQADFARMLSQFKDKVSENLDSSDVRAHHDLGTAYKEMGLLDEAISSFQAALRASPHHLPTYELMGQTFLEMNQPEAAVRSLERALTNPSAVEDELVGIYYYLGRSYESLEKPDSALEYYDRVFSLDINFADVTERLRALR
jgi:tetratricopeptide (TPR) repeat protein